MCIVNRGFEWDEEKKNLNFIKHGIHFIDAIMAFDDPAGLIEEDLAHSQNERRQRLIGYAILRKVVVNMFTTRKCFLDQLC